MEKLEIKSGSNIINVDAYLTGNGSIDTPIEYTGQFQHADKRTLLWESTSNNYNTNITLSEPVAHFDKIMIYGSGLEANDTMHVSKNVYKTQDKLMGCDAWCYSPWTTSFQANYILAANLKISGNSGHIGGSMYWGIGSKNATWAAGKWTGTEAPKMLMPWKIFGIDRHPTYNFYVLTSEGGSVSSDINPGYSGDIATITVIPNGDEWRQSALNISGATLTGNEFMYENSNVTASAGFEHSKVLIIEPTIGGVITANLNSGFSGDVVTLIVESTDEGYKFSSYSLTGSEATGNDIMFTDSDITAQGNFEHYKSLTLENGDHGILSADKTSGFIGDVVTVNATTDEGWYLSGIALTGAEATGLKFMFTGSDVTALGEYTDVGFPVTYLTDEHVHLTGDQIYIPGTEGITLDSGYDTYYRISGYDITGGSIIDGKLVPTGPCTIKAVEKVNYFSASGEFEKGSNITWQFTGSNGKSTTIPAKYALCTYMTDNVPAEWYSDNNRWKVNDASAYSITLHPVMHFSGWGIQQGYTAIYARYTGYSLVGDDISAQANASYTKANTWDFNKTYTSDTQNVYYRLSGLLWANGANSQGWYAKAQYLTAGSTGTWSASGIAP